MGYPAYVKCKCKKVLLPRGGRWIPERRGWAVPYWCFCYKQLIIVLYKEHGDTEIMIAQPKPEGLDDL